MGEKRNACRLLAIKTEGKRTLGRSRRGRVDNIKMDLVEIGLGLVHWIGVVQDRYKWGSLVNTVMKIQVLENAGHLSSGYTSSRLSSSAHPHRVS
jgi:hypothetical protein